MGSFSNNDGLSVKINDASGFQFNVATKGSKIEATQNNNPALSEIRNLLDDLLSKIPDELSEEIKKQIRDTISGIKGELQKPVPNKGAIRSMLSGMKTLSNGVQFVAAITTIIKNFTG
jgi:hypothetical protein